MEKGITKKATTTDGNETSMDNPANINEQHYEMMTDNVIKKAMVSSVYQSLLKPDINMFTTSNIVLGTILSEGNFYQTWKGKLTQNKSAPLQIVIKKTKDLKLLIMEVAPLGNLRQYLEIKANEMYYNVTSSKTLEMDFINQIIEASDVVHQLDPPGLFYCLCSSNVLLSSDQKCKLSGFASKESVRAREKWEEEYNLPRPIQWLAPEAIKLSHVIESDIWSLGLLMWEIFNAGKLPFGDVTDDEARQKVLKGQKPFKPTKCSDDMFDIMTQCWMCQPFNRPSLHDISVKCNELIQYEEV
ncbi:hypothetical protein LSH36_2049g00039 [Paralvinella palmiformis]|uniref:Protein kinase domain-containing protein n=1 Tax=Paralvinella palmiformis TaxID=53620 RepID=A0AAD9IRJ9_9ANNE|nr:hypothetical protein LSH36_2049g00039 [Paralvinella palmiformis]